MSPLEDKRASSGTFHTMAKALESIGAEVVWIPVKEKNLWYKLYLKAVKEACRFFPKLKPRLPKLQMWKCGIISRSMDKELVDSSDVLFVPMQSWSMFHLDTDRPIIYSSDGTYHLMIGYYWSDLPRRDIREFELMEQTALDKATALVYPSRWAADSAVKDYGQPQDKITIARYGPNFSMDEIAPHAFTFDGHLDILFVGVDWKRKGGQIAVDACKWLNDNGVDATLHIAGIKDLDRDVASLPFVDDKGFLNKNKPEEYAVLKSLYSNADCFLLPTLAECTGISFCEASAFGLPCFTHDTGGVSDYVFEGESGRLLPIGSTGEDFGRKIKECLENGDMERMALSAPVVSRERLSWDKWAAAMEEVIEQVSGVA